MFKYTFLITILWFGCGILRAQVIDSRQFPNDINWKRIETSHFELIFPEEIEEEARRLALKMETLYLPVSKSLSVSPARIPILLSNRTATSNGFVTYAPRRSEWEHLPAFPVYSDFLGESDWINLLAIHEYRHVAQMAKLNRGMVRIAGAIAGEYGLSVGSAAAAPPWFWEGDAVGVETAMTDGGRGRVPQFDMHIRALSLAGTRYPYVKAHHRSYKDWYPSHYPLGYLLTTYVRREYGSEAWSKTLERAAQIAFVPFAFSTGLNKTVGLGTGGLYDEAMSELDSLWQAQSRERTIDEFSPVSPSTNRWTNFLYPHIRENGSIITVRYGLEDPPTWTLLHTDGETESIGNADPDLITYGFDYAAGKLVWNSVRPDIRFGKASHSELRIRNLETRSERAIEHPDPLFIPAISSDGSLVAAVSYLPTRSVGVVILDLNTEEEIGTFSFPDYSFISALSWSPDSKQLAIVFHTDQGKGIATFSIETDSVETILPAGIENPLHIRFGKGKIYYSSSLSGVDELYAIFTDSGKRFRILSRSVGVFHPDVNRNDSLLVFNDYGVEGYAVGQVPLSGLQWEPADQIASNKIDFFEPLIEQEDEIDLDVVQGDSVLPVLPFDMLRDRMKWHSWFPFADDRELGFQMDAKNLLNTRGASAGLQFDRNERVLRGFGQMRMARLFPVVDISVDHGFRAQRYTVPGGDEFVDRWKESRFSAGIFVPLNLSRSAIRRNVTVGINSSLIQLDGQEVTAPYDNGNGRIASLAYQINFRRSLPSAVSDFRPRSSQVFRIFFRHTPFESDYRGAQLAASAEFYFPGFAPHHSLLVSGVIEAQRPDLYRYSSIYTVSRGYRYRYDDTIWKLSASYAFPVAYPDAGLSTALYIKRVRAAVFADYGKGQTGEQVTLYRSAGLELITDNRFLDIPSEVSVGIRTSYRFEDHSIHVAPLIGFSF